MLDRLMGDALLDEAMAPVAERRRRHAERSLLGLPDAAAAGGRVLPGEEGQDRAGRAGLVAVIEVIGAGIIEIDGLLDEPQTERPRIKLEISQRVTGDCGDMMDT